MRHPRRPAGESVRTLARRLAGVGRLSVGLLGLGMALAWGVSGRAVAEEAPAPTTLPQGSLADVTLSDGRTPPASLAPASSTPVVVLAFLGTECPLAKLYAVDLSRLSRDYVDRGVVVYGIDSNAQDSLEEIAAMVRRQELAFPVFRDAGNALADRLDARRTPEVFVLDAAREVKYRGRIDDRLGVGVIRDKATTHELADAIEALLAGRPVATPVTEAIGCQIGRVKTPDEGAAVTWHGQIADLFRARCVECHRPGDIGPFALTEYEEAAGWAEMIAEVVEQKRMPPWHADPEHGTFVGDRRLTEQEHRLIADWVAAGAPEGPPREHAPLTPRAAGWQLPTEPDASFTVQATPYRVPATGEVRYQWFEIDPGFAEDKWTRAIEIVPGNRMVVHHVLAFAVPKGEGVSGRLGGGAHGFLAGYVPGLRVRIAPDGMAKKIPANSRIIFQVHYTPIGSPQEDQSRIGFWFADPATVTREIKTTSALQTRFKIPPNDPAHTVTGQETIDKDALLLGFMPHMHLRGSAFKYELQPPKKGFFGSTPKKEVLLDIPEYDFNWQTAYQLVTPRPIAAGSTIIAHGTFDNSTGNLANPDPDSTVTWGDQTWEEMMIGYFDIAVPRKDDKSAEEIAAERAAEAKRRIDLVMSRLDADGDGAIGRDEASVFPQLKRHFDALDADKSGGISRAEFEAISDIIAGIKLPGGG